MTKEDGKVFGVVKRYPSPRRSRHSVLHHQAKQVIGCLWTISALRLGMNVSRPMSLRLWLIGGQK